MKKFSIRFIFKCCLFFGLLEIAGCKDFSLMSFKNRNELLASVGKQELYLDDVKGIFREGMTSEDSLAILQAYVNQWVKTSIKIAEAENYFEEEQDDIERLIKAYRNSLITYKYDQVLTSGVDTLVTMAQITAYYNENKEQFRLVGPIVKARVLAYNEGYRQEKQLKELLRSTKEEDYFDLQDIVKKSSFKVNEFTDKWYYFKDVLQYIPFTDKNFDNFLKKNSFYEISDNDNKYMMAIFVYRNTGDYIPVEMVTHTIRTAIVNKRRTDYIKQVEDSIYMQALEDGRIKVQIDTVLNKTKEEN